MIMEFSLLIYWALSALLISSAVVFFRAFITQGLKQGHNQFRMKLLPMPIERISQSSKK